MQNDNNNNDNNNNNNNNRKRKDGTRENPIIICYDDNRVKRQRIPKKITENHSKETIDSLKFIREFPVWKLVFPYLASLKDFNALRTCSRSHGCLVANHLADRSYAPYNRKRHGCLGIIASIQEKFGDGLEKELDSFFNNTTSFAEGEFPLRKVFYTLASRYRLQEIMMYFILRHPEPVSQDFLQYAQSKGRMIADSPDSFLVPKEFFLSEKRKIDIGENPISKSLYDLANTVSRNLVGKTIFTHKYEFHPNMWYGSDSLGNFNEEKRGRRRRWLVPCPFVPLLFRWLISPESEYKITEEQWLIIAAYFVDKNDTRMFKIILMMIFAFRPFVKGVLFRNQEEIKPESVNLFSSPHENRYYMAGLIDENHTKKYDFLDNHKYLAPCLKAGQYYMLLMLGARLWKLKPIDQTYKIESLPCNNILKFAIMVFGLHCVSDSKTTHYSKKMASSIEKTLGKREENIEQIYRDYEFLQQIW